MTGLPGAEPPDMAAASGAPLDELRAEAAQVRVASPTFAIASPLPDLREEVRRQAARWAAFEARMPEVQRAAAVADRLRMSGLREDELEWLVPGSYGWGDPGQDSFQLLGISMRIVEGIEQIYLGVKVQS